jgi:hypothetical protein
LNSAVSEEPPPPPRKLPPVEKEIHTAETVPHSDSTEPKV